MPSTSKQKKDSSKKDTAASSSSSELISLRPNNQETLLCQRIIKCGARSTNDLDAQRASLILAQNETYHDFYQQCRSVEREYELQYGESRLIPKIKILSRLVGELARSQNYMPYLMSYQNDLSDYIEMFYDQDHSAPIPFTMKKLYNHLVRNNVPDVSTHTLRPSEHKIVTSSPPASTSNEHGPSIVASIEHMTNDSLIHDNTYFDDNEYASNSNEDEIRPTILAMQRRQRERCQVCLMGFHTPDECYLCGKNFVPKELAQRINLYNKQFGDKLPTGKQPRQWTPQSIPAIHSSNQNRKVPTQPNPSERKKFAPFQNYRTKSNGPNVNVLVEDNGDDGQHDVNDIDMNQFVPSINSFLADQHELSHGNDNDLLDNHDPHVCSYEINLDLENVFSIVSILNQTNQTVSIPITSEPSFKPSDIIPLPQNKNNVSDYTPEQLLTTFSKVNSNNSSKPRRSFLQKHNRDISILPTQILFCDVSN